jgi:hopene-associated glycosyltransferase HpnB
MLWLAVIGAMIWGYLLTGHGRFWQEGPILPAQMPAENASDVAIIVPARDEADQIEVVLKSLLAQNYPGKFTVFLIDDQSIDGTGDIAAGIGDARLKIIEGVERPLGWAGKLWAVSQGIEAAGDSELLFLTDADILHEPGHLSALVAKIEADKLDMVSEMVALRVKNIAEKLMIPAFVYFFAMLYPFDWVNDPENPVAAAAGGSVLLRARALRAAGGIEAMHDALIDDVSLGGLLKKKGRIYLGHSQFACSIRPYDGLGEIWRMIARSAYVQLHYLPQLLLGTVMGMALVFLAAPFVVVCGHGFAQFLAILTWVASTASYVPTLRREKLSPAWALLLPLIAIFYVAATIGSAGDHYRGAGVQWKRRAYTA